MAAVLNFGGDLLLVPRTGIVGAAVLGSDAYEMWLTHNRKQGLSDLGGEHRRRQWLRFGCL